MLSKLLNLLAAGSFVTLSLAAIGCAAPSVDTSEPTNEQDSHLLGGTRLTPSEVADHLRSAGFPSSAIGKMVCTAKYESSYYEKATNKNSNGSTDYGLFQINSQHLGTMKGCPSSSSTLFDPTANAKCAFAIYSAQGINAWYGYQKHKSECDKTKAPAPTGSTSTSSSGSVSTTSSSSSSTSGSVTSSSGSTTYTGDDDDDDTTTTTSSSGSTGSTSSSGSSGSTTSTGDDDDDDGATIDPNDGYDLGGGCWSSTVGDMMDPLACVQSSADGGAWEQCKDGQWYRGTEVQGPFGYCNGTYPLQ